MVMKRNMMRRNLSRSIMKSIGRYLAIVAIIALGASMFVGLLMTKTDMVATGQVYTDQQNMFDLRLISTYGWDLDTAEKVAELEGVVDAENLIYLDLIATLNDSSDDSVYCAVIGVSSLAVVHFGYGTDRCGQDIMESSRTVALRCPGTGTDGHGFRMRERDPEIL